ncbi:MAG: hypothetical protein SGILL_005901 [Bacillariaceae sp.]
MTNDTRKSKTETLAQDAAMLETIVDASSTMDLHRSNLMRLQVQELLEECQLKDLSTRKWAEEAHEYLQVVTKCIEKITFKTLLLAEGEASGANTNSPIAIKHRADKVVYIEPPSSKKRSALLQLEPLGFTKNQFAWTKKSGNAQQVPTFSFLVVLPKEFFLPKDYLHYRYFDKRNFVMNKVAMYLSKQTKKLGRVEYQWAKGTGRPPYIQLLPRSNSDSKKSAKFQVHLHFGIKSVDWIAPLRLVPNRCNLKQLEDSEEHSASPAERAKSIESQLYNQSLLYDARHEFEEDHLASLSEYANIEATLVLVQIWALKRGLWRNHDGWTIENVAIFLLYLLRTNRMNPRMTPMQQFTVALQIWATNDWLGTGAASKISDEDDHRQARGSVSQGTQFANSGKVSRRHVLVLPMEDTSEKETIRQSDLARFYEQQTKDSPLTDNDAPTLIEAYASLEHYRLGPVMLDPTMTYNFLGDVSSNYMKLLQRHSAKSLQGLKATRSSFGFMFMENARFWNQWDTYVQIPVKKNPDGEWEPAVRHLVEKLELGLGDRIKGMRILSTGNGDVSLEHANLDNIPGEVISKESDGKRALYLSPTASKKIVVGISINPEASQRVVDRGPPSDQSQEVKAFIGLWGAKAQLRRFKDGAIVQAVVWNDDDGVDTYQNKEKLQGGYVEKIVRHIVRVHYTRERINFALPNLLSVVDGIKNKDTQADASVDPVLAHQQVLKAYESLALLLRESSQPIQINRQQSSLGLPLAIDAVEPLSPSLRYSELFPPVPHPFLGSASSGSKKVSGAVTSDPVLVQIRFGASSKWPSDLNAIGAAKTAMLLQLANGIDNLNDKNFDGPTVVTPSYLDLGYKGYCFRIIVRADPEIKMLQGLVRPSPVASALLKDLTKMHVTAAKHHSMIHAVHTLHPSSTGVVRMAKRWVANHLFSGLIATEAIELMVAKVYSPEETPTEVPATVTSGFLRFLQLLASHDWLGEPLVVNPRRHLEEADIDEVYAQFEKARADTKESSPPLFIVAPYDKKEVDEDDPMNQNAVDTSNRRSWWPSTDSPEWVVVSRAVVLAKRSYQFMVKRLVDFDDSADWSAIFQESATSFQSYSVLLRVSVDLVVDQEASSTGADLSPICNEKGVLETSYTRSMKARIQGPKALRRKVYRNLQNDSNEANDTLLLSWQPIESVFSVLRQKFGAHALFFYNELAPEVICLVWRPDTFKAIPFSAMTAEFAMPESADSSEWKVDSLVVRNSKDLLREMSEYYQDVVTTAKTLDSPGRSSSSKRKRSTSQ